VLRAGRGDERRDAVCTNQHLDRLVLERGQPIEPGRQACGPRSGFESGEAAACCSRIMRVQ
jgi:hypothetical protein